MKPIYKFIAVAVWALLLPNTLFAEQVTITVDQAVEMALEYNLNLQSSELSLNQAYRSRESSWNNFLPSITADATFTNPAQSATSGQTRTAGLSGGFSASLTLNPILYDRMKAAALDYQAGVVEYDTAKKQLTRDVSIAFYGLLLAQSQIEVEKQAIDIAEKQYRLSEANYKAGLVSRYSMLSAQVTWENMKPTLDDYLVSYESSLATFKNYLNLDQDTDLLLSGGMDAKSVKLDSKQLIKEFMDDRLDVQSAEIVLMQLKNDYKQAKSSLLPSLTVKYDLDSALQGDAYETTWFKGNNWSDMSGTAMLILTIPIDSFIPGSSTATTIANTLDQMAQQKLTIENKKKEAAVEIHNLIREIDKSSDSLKSLKMNVDLAEEAYKLAEEGYAAGVTQLLDVQNAQVELQEAQLKVLSEEYTYITGLLNLQYALNGKTW